MKKWTKNWTTPLRALLSGVGVGAAALIVPMIVSAVMPPANSNIGNKAVATYVDAAGQPQNVESNPVSTIVAQIGSMTLTNDGTKSVAPGTTAYFSHTLTNTGNGSDTFTIKAVDNGTGFTSVAIYPDPNGDGTPSTLIPLCATPKQTGINLCSDGFTQLLASNGLFRFIAAYQVPATASAPTTPYDTGTITVTPPMGTTVPYTPASVSNTDTVNTTREAAFTATKALAAPGVQPPSGAWPTVLTTGKASPASCNTSAATTWSATLVSSHPECTYTVYTLSYVNNGGATGNFSISDVIGTGNTAGLTYVTGSAVWSGAGGQALSENGGTTGTGTSKVKSTWDSANKKFLATVTNVAATVSGTISFVVLVDSDATVGSEATTNKGKYWSTSCDATLPPSASNCGSSTPPSETNPSDFPIPVTYGVVAANASGLTTPDGTTPPGTPPADTGINLVEMPTVAPGGSVSFKNWITNTGNASDSFKLAVQSLSGASGTAAFPAGTTYAFYKEDGFTPFVTADTGPVAAGASIAVVVRATIPPSTPTAGTTPYEALLTATSDNGTGVSDSVWDRVADVAPLPVKVDLTNTAGGNKAINGTTITDCTPGTNCDVGPGPSTGPTDTQYTTPGTGVIFPIFVKDTDTVDGTYNLTATVPSGWTVKFVAAGGTCASSAIAQPLAVTAGSQTEVEACVTPPANTPVGTTNVFITATSSTDPAIHDTITDAVAVQAPIIKSMTLTPPFTNSTASGGGTVIDPATLTNTGNQNCGGSTGFTVSATFVETGLANAGWQAVVYFDRSPVGTIGLEDEALPAGIANLTPAIAKDPAGTGAPMIPLLPGKSLPLLVKIFAPTNALNGTVATVNLTVNDANTTTADQCPAQSSKITTTVSNGTLRIDKTQALDATCDGAPDTAYSAATIPVTPGQCIAYKVMAHNDGAVNVTNVVINDTAPGYTTYQATPVAGTCAVAGGTGTPVFTFDAASQAVKCAPTTGGVTLAPAGTMTMLFNVKVDGL